MCLSYQVLIFIHAGTTGLIAPVMTLMFLQHGASLNILSLFVALFSLTVLLAEIPSGIFADTYGRKKCFLLSLIFLICKDSFLLISNDPILLSVSCIFFGLGNAFSSGSLEALIIEQYKSTVGVVRINSQMFFLESIGMAAGALLGGFLGSIGTRYCPLIAVVLAFEIFIFILSQIFLKEQLCTEDRKETGSLKANFIHMFSGKNYSHSVKMILTATVFIGILQTVLDVYWQQTFVTYMPSDFLYLIGVISCMGFAGLIAGNYFVEWILTQKVYKEKTIYWVFKFLLPVSMLLLGFCQNWILFGCSYTFVHFIIGCGEVSEKAILHQNVDDSQRSSVLSIYSFIIRIGGIFSSLLCSFLVRHYGLSSVWIVIPAAALLALSLIRRK